MRSLVALLLVVFLEVACVSQAAKEAFERYANSRIGRPHSDLSARVECGERAGEYGCLRTDFRNCRVWFSVDRVTGLINSWRYEQNAENCWKEV